MERKKGARRLVEVVLSHICAMTGVAPEELYREPGRFKPFYEAARGRLREVFGDEFENIRMPPVQCLACSYGHMAALGAEVSFNTDYAMRPFVSSVREGIALLKRAVDFSDNALFRHFAAYTERLRLDYGREVPFGGYGAQGPITSAVLMRGQDFFMDLYDSPEETLEFLTRLTDSITAFHGFLRTLNGQPLRTGAASRQGLADDFAALVSPHLFEKFVVPFWNRYYAALSDGPRFVHCEGLLRPHLPMLKQAGIGYFQASVSPQLTWHMLAEALEPDCAFDWLLTSFEILNMTGDEVEAWVRDAASSGAETLRTQTVGQTFSEGKEGLILRFLNSAKAFA